MASAEWRTKADWDRAGREFLSGLLRDKKDLQFCETATPQVSVVLVLHNKAHLTALCLEALLTNADVAYEVIILDNNSTDETAALLSLCPGAKVIRNPHNAGFGEACMQGAAAASGEYLLFLNNDALLGEFSLSAALRNFEDHTVGAVGGKILLANGDLQEAGSIIWSDGSALGYGRGGNPEAPQYNFRRPVDYCSGAFLFTPRELFQDLGGFDSAYSPAYYEDTDYCMKVWRSGRKVLYEPSAVVRHYESASSGGNEAAQPMMAAKQKIFVERWASELTRHLPASARNVLRSRVASQPEALRILYIDDRVPHRTLGSGYPRSNDILRALVAQGHLVTCVSFAFPIGAIEDEYRDIPREVEILEARAKDKKLYAEYLPIMDVVWISRPHNMSAFLDEVVDRYELRPKLVFDSEAIFAERERISVEVSHRNVADSIIEARLRREIALASAADAVTVVSERDRATLERSGVKNVNLLGHSLAARPTARAFAERENFLFLGAVHEERSPNADSMRFLCREVWPAVQRKTGAQLMIAGFGTDVHLAELAGDSVTVLGPVRDLWELYNTARVVVVPTRYAAGIPFKAHEAASYGVPMVVSSLIGEQLAWPNGEELLVAHSPKSYVDECCRLYKDQALWTAIRTNALVRILCEFDRRTFEGTVASVIESVLAPAT